MPATLAQVTDDLNDYSDFEEVGSVSRAKSYVTAANRWLLLAAGSASNEASSLSRNVPQIEAMKNRALAYIAANDTTTTSGPGGVRFLGVAGGFR